MIGAAIAGGYWYDRVEAEQRAVTVRELESVSALVLNEIVQWRRERLGDAHALAADPDYRQLAGRVLAGTADRTAEAELRARLHGFTDAYGQYDEQLVVRANGEVVFAEPGTGATLSPAIQPLVTDAIRRGTPQLIPCSSAYSRLTTAALGIAFHDLAVRHPEDSRSAHPVTTG